MQVGALRALIEAGFQPDLLVGTSIGAVNATGLAHWGVNLAGIEALEQAYRQVAVSNLMDPRLTRLALRALSGRPNHHASRRVAELFISKGVSPDLHFDQITAGSTLVGMSSETIESAPQCVFQAGVIYQAKSRRPVPASGTPLP